MTEKADEKDRPEIVKVSGLSRAKKEEKARVMVMDQKLRRKVQPGEEEKLEEVAREAGVEEVDLGLEEAPGGPAGSTTISGATISVSSLAYYIARDFGPVAPGGAIFLSDSFYFLYPDSQIRKVLSEDLTDLQLWIAQYFDCDDFAQVVAGVVNKQLMGLPFGTLWFRGPGIYHAVNCFYSREQRKMKIVEPQTDAIYDFNKARYDPVLVVL